MPSGSLQLVTSTSNIVTIVLHSGLYCSSDAAWTTTGKAASKEQEILAAPKLLEMVCLYDIIKGYA